MSKSPAPSVECLTWSEQQVAAALGVSTATVRRMKSAGKLPPPRKVGGLTKYVRTEVEEWLRDGCPPCPAGEKPPKRAPRR